MPVQLDVISEAPMRQYSLPSNARYRKAAIWLFTVFTLAWPPTVFAITGPIGNPQMSPPAHPVEPDPTLEAIDNAMMEIEITTLEQCLSMCHMGAANCAVMPDPAACFGEADRCQWDCGKKFKPTR